MACALDSLAERWPGLDMAKLRILREIDNRPGVFMCDIAEALRVSHQHVQFHVASMSDGKKGREKAALGLVRTELCTADKRYRELYLTREGLKAVRLARPLLGPSQRNETQLTLPA